MLRGGARRRSQPRGGSRVVQPRRHARAGEPLHPPPSPTRGVPCAPSATLCAQSCALVASVPPRPATPLPLTPRHLRCSRTVAFFGHAAPRAQVESGVLLRDPEVPPQPPPARHPAAPRRRCHMAPKLVTTGGLEAARAPLPRGRGLRARATAREMTSFRIGARSRGRRWTRSRARGAARA